MEVHFVEIKSPTFIALNPFAFYGNKATHLGYRPDVAIVSRKIECDVLSR